MTEYHKSSIFNLRYSFSLLFTCILALFLIVTTGESEAQTWHTVRWVNDGDTIVLSSGQRIRYIGINAPEIDHDAEQKAQPYGHQAKRLNQQLVFSKRIRLEYGAQRYDRYGRTLAYIFLEDGSLVNARLLEAGLAFYLYHPPNVNYNEILRQAQLNAMNRNLGLWHNWKIKAKRFIGNRVSRRFHDSACPFAEKIRPQNKVKFASKWDAFRSGYSPSTKCIAEFWSYGAGE